jgi:Sulfotransferase family
MTIRTALKTTVKYLGLKPALERGFLESGLLGERLQFLFRSRPDPSEALVLAGSARSGTTWVADLVCSVPGIQQIFEPLRELPRWLPEGAPAYPKTCYLRPEGHYPHWDHVLSRVLTGQSRTYWTDTARTSFFPKRYLIKEIRASLMLGYLHDHFQPRIAYLSRHPCAVVASRIGLGWQLDLNNLLSQEELIEDHLSPWLAQIERARTSPVATHAIWLAVESRVALHHLSTRPHCHAYYEHLLVEPEATLRSILSRLDLSVARIPEGRIKRNSRTTWRERMAKDPHEKEYALSNWKRRLSREDQREVLDWAYRLGVTCYSDQSLPVSS